jgi:hypothetical protein
MKIEVVCTLRFEGTHRWPGAEGEVAFLASIHRHEFHVKAYREVRHADRDYEIITLKRDMTRYIESAYPDGNLGTKSCEMLAMELLAQFNLSQCEVLEDGENGARVTA